MPNPAPQQPYPAPWQPQAADRSLQHGEAFIEEMDILVMESFPPQYTLTLQGTLPTPCHQLRVELAPPDSQNVIQVSAYSVVDPNAICAQVLAPFEASVPLQGQPSGTYTVVVNEDEAGSIEVP
jgi:inhibitor of cysteine peptidase